MAKKKPEKEQTQPTAAAGKLSRKAFEKELYELQVELVRLQSWVTAEGKRIILNSAV